MKFIESNIIKIALSATISVLVANRIGLEFGVTSGVISILSIGCTKKGALKVGGKRLIAATIAVLISYFLYILLGNNSIVFGLFLLIFIPITKALNVDEGMVVGAVLSTHLLVSSDINFKWIINEELLTVIGIGVASIFNLYMPSLEDEFNKNKDFIEEMYRVIFSNMAESLITKAVSVNEKKILEEVEEKINIAKEIAYKINDNLLFKSNLYYSDYIEMRIMQLEKIKNMQSHFSRFSITYDQTVIMSEFTRKIANNIHSDNDCVELINNIEMLRKEYKQMDLPRSREEFENRAMLFQFLNDMEDFLRLKGEFKNKY